jgi:hypothetical protein
MKLTIWVVSGCKHNSVAEDTAFSEIHYSYESACKSVAGWLGVESFNGWSDAGDAVMEAYDAGGFQSLEIHGHEIDRPGASFIDDHGTAYQPINHDGSVGYRIKGADGSDSTLILNPSMSSDDESSNVFLYHDATAPGDDPPLESPVIYVTTSEVEPHSPLFPTK